MSIDSYGKLQSEKIAEENLICRKIADEISRFGINDRQRKFLIFLLSLEIEDIELMKSISILVREKSDGSNFLAEKDDYDSEVK